MVLLQDGMVEHISYGVVAANKILEQRLKIIGNLEPYSGYQTQRLLNFVCKGLVHVLKETEDHSLHNYGVYIR